MMKQRKLPLRKCIVCGERKDKRDLMRIVKNKEEEVFVDSTGKANGRGAYICKNIECLNNAKKNNKLSRALKTRVQESMYNELQEEINNG